MKININDMKISEIQDVFNFCFPYLKIMFFNLEHSPDESAHGVNLIQNDKLFQEIRTLNEANMIDLNKNLKVSLFEKQFVENFGIKVQVYRKSANIWLQTEATDEWTLAEQNAQGKEMDQKVGIEKSDDFDSYHEQL